MSLREQKHVRLIDMVECLRWSGEGSAAKQENLETSWNQYTCLSNFELIGLKKSNYFQILTACSIIYK